MRRKQLAIFLILDLLTYQDFVLEFIVLAKIRPRHTLHVEMNQTTTERIVSM